MSGIADIDGSSHSTGLFEVGDGVSTVAYRLSQPTALREVCELPSGVGLKGF